MVITLLREIKVNIRLQKKIMTLYMKIVMIARMHREQKQLLMVSIVRVNQFKIDLYLIIKMDLFVNLNS